MTEYLSIGLVAAILATLHRAAILWVYRSWFRQGFAGDAAFHITVVRQIKRTGGYDGVREFLIRDEADTYPILFHRIAALFPLRIVDRYPFAPNAVIWVVAMAASALYVHYVSSQLLGLNGVRFALTFVVLFLALASNLALDMNGINYISLSERLLSRFCCGGYFMALAVFLTFADWLSLAAAIVLGTMALVSSMFGRQTLFFVTPLVALIALNVWPLLVLAACVLGAVIADRGYFLRGLRHMKLFSHAYRQHTKHSRYYKLGLSRFVDLKRMLARGSGIGSRIHEVEHNEPTKILFRYPELILMIGLSAAWPGLMTKPEIAVVVATLIVYLATSTSALRQYGEANRYIEFALWLIPAFSLTKYAVMGGVPAMIWLIYAAWVGVVTFKKYRDWSRLSYPFSDVLSEFLAPLRLGPDATVFAVPFTLGAAINVRTNCRALMYQGSAVSLGLYERFMEEVPFLKRDWQPLASEFQVTHIIGERSYLDIMKSLLGWEYDFSNTHKVAESDRYVAYRVDGPRRVVVQQAVVAEPC